MKGSESERVRKREYLNIGRPITNDSDYQLRFSDPCLSFAAKVTYLIFLEPVPISTVFVMMSII